MASLCRKRLSRMGVEPSGYTVFCDDVRYEVSGKLSYIGIYTGVLFINVAAYPVMLPKFCFAITYSEPVELRTEKMTVNIYLPGDSEDGKPSLAQEMSVQSPGDLVALTDPMIPPTERHLFIIRHEIISTPLILKADGFIKVRAKVGDGIVKIGSLRVLLNRPKK